MQKPFTKSKQNPKIPVKDTGYHIEKGPNAVTKPYSGSQAMTAFISET